MVPLNKKIPMYRYFSINSVGICGPAFNYGIKHISNSKHIRLLHTMGKVVFGFCLFVILIYYGVMKLSKETQYINHCQEEIIKVKMELNVAESGNITTVTRRLLESLPKGYNLSRDSLQVYSEQYIVPNIVHFIWFGENKTLTFINYLSMVSAWRIHKPEMFMLHCNNLPVGEYWHNLWQEVPIQIVYMEAPSFIHGQKLEHMYHKGDIAKFEVLLKYGGIYLDYDVIVLRSLDQLRYYDTTLGKEKAPKLNAGMIIARKNAPFLQILYESYKDSYHGFDWDFNCARVSFKLYEKAKDLVHVEPYKLTTPDFTERNKLFQEVIDWKGMGLYTIHAMIHADTTIYTPDNIRGINSTFGEVVRYIYYGSPSLLHKDD